MNIELIEWYDHHTSNNGWRNEINPTCFDLVICKTTGFIVKETKTTIMLAHSVSEEGDVNQCMTIGKKLIISRKILKKGK